MMTTVHLACAAAFGIVVALYFGRMWFEGADRAAMLAMQHDPEGIVPFGLHGLNPFTWLYGAIALLFLLGPFLSPALLAVSVPVLVFGRQALSRPAANWLIAAAVTAVVLPVLRLSPLGADVTTWWID